MRSLVLLLAILALGGCMNVSDMAEGTRYHMSDAGLLDHSDSRRVNNLRIQPDSFIYIAQGAFAPPGSTTYPRPNVIAEVAFDGIPGKVFAGRVKSVIGVIAEGQVQPSGTLISYTGSPPAGRVPVIIEITDPAFAPYSSLMPGGAYGQAALYSQHFHHIGAMRKILLRMAAWMNYIFPFH